jgi:hypothetical protein
VGTEKRTPFQQEVVEALLDSQAINIEAMGSVFSRFGAKALLEGESLVQIITGKAMWNCGWPFPILDVGRFESLDQQLNQ